MSADDKIFVDATQPAILRFSGACLSFGDLRSAIAEWRKLPPDIKREAAILSADGAIYDMSDIPALYDRRLVSRAP